MGDDGVSEGIIGFVELDLLNSKVTWNTAVIHRSFCFATTPSVNAVIMLWCANGKSEVANIVDFTDNAPRLAHSQWVFAYLHLLGIGTIFTFPPLLYGYMLIRWEHLHWAPLFAIKRS